MNGIHEYSMYITDKSTYPYQLSHLLLASNIEILLPYKNYGSCDFFYGPQYVISFPK